jgi:hypothetical protein
MTTKSIGVTSSLWISTRKRGVKRGGGGAVSGSRTPGTPDGLAANVIRAV